MNNSTSKLGLVFFICLFTLTACDKNNDEEVKIAVQNALAEERAKQAELNAIKEANEKQIQERVKEEVQKELQRTSTQKTETPKPITNKVAVEQANIGYIMTQTDGYVYLRNTPNASGRKLRKLDDYTLVAVRECLGYEYRDDVTSGNEGSWCRVQTEDGLTGYVFNSYIRSGRP